VEPRVPPWVHQRQGGSAMSFNTILFTVAVTTFATMLVVEFVYEIGGW